MSVEFNENNPFGQINSVQTTGLTGRLIKWGLVKNEAGARKVLLAIAIICFALSIYFFTKI